MTLRPFTSLAALTFFVSASLILAGCSELLGTGNSASPTGARISGGMLIAAGLVAALAPGLTVRGIAIVVGVGMLLSGGARVAAGWRGKRDERYSSILGGLAGIVFGILALAWPDITILVVALLVGPVAIVFGAREVLRALSVLPDPFTAGAMFVQGQILKHGWVLVSLAKGLEAGPSGNAVRKLHGRGLQQRLCRRRLR